MRHRRCGDIARTLASGFAYQGEPSAHRDGSAARRAERRRSPPTAFVNFLQNHDQIGNRALGDRLERTADPEAIEAALAITLLAPMPPMLFMGEEWGSTAPFPFFCDFDGELAEAVRKGRRREFADAYAKYGDDMPDPLGAVDLPIRDAGLGCARQAAGTRAAGAGAGAAARSAAQRSCRGLPARRSARRMSADNGC